MMKFTSFTYVSKDHRKAKASEDDVHLNVVKIAYDTLKDRAFAYNQAPTLCKACNSALNMYSERLDFD